MVTAAGLSALVEVHDEDELDRAFLRTAMEELNLSARAYGGNG